MNQTPTPQTPEKYITCFRQLAAITSDAMDRVERNPSPTLAQNLECLAKSVEVLSFLRGDAGIFWDSRPDGLTEFQNEMYATEDHLRARLLGLGYTYELPRHLRNAE